jgi:hypothetical protein
MTKKTHQYLALEVPHGTDEKGSGQSYLRMGNLPGSNESPSDHEPGDDDILVKRGILAADARGQPTPPAWPDKMHQSFITTACTDNMRTGGDQEPPAPPVPWKDNLGWRDHSHGNRVSTTFGDKVEVITGNYKLIVLGGRDGEHSTGFDMSGGHTVNWAQTPGCIKRIWADGDKWVVTWSTESANERRFYDGKSYLHAVGGADYYSVQYVGGAHPEMPSSKGGPIMLSRNTTFSQQIVGEALGKEVWNVTAGSPARGSPDFDEMAMIRMPPRDAPGVDAWVYGAAKFVHDVKVAEESFETNRIFKKRVVDTECPDLQQKATIATFADEYRGATRTIKAVTTSLDQDEKYSSGGVHSTCVSLERRDMSVAANHFNLRFGVASEDINMQLGGHLSFVSAPAVANLTLAGALFNYTFAPFRFGDTECPSVEEKKGMTVEEFEDCIKKAKMVVEFIEFIFMLL